MLFQITNVREKKTSHCGVLEFSGTEGQVYLPYWVRNCNCFYRCSRGVIDTRV